MRTQPRTPQHITCDRYGETPNHGGRQLLRKQRRCRCAPKVRPNERLCNTISSQRRQMALPIFRGNGDIVFRWRDSDNPCGTPAPITAVHFPTTIRNVHTHEAMPNYNSHAGTSNLAVSPAMLTRQVLGCRGSEPTEGRPAGSQLAAMNEKCYSVNHSDAAARWTGQKPPRLTA